MKKVELQSDRIAAANLERRRNRELQRKERIFNEKVRTIGIDKDALDYQVQERRDQGRREAEILNAYASDMVHHDQVANLLDSRQSRDRRRLEETIQHFRQNFQQPESRREFDLNDPDLLKKQERGGQVLPGLAGEDPGKRDRVKRQQEQLREWAQQQQQELDMAKQQQRQEDLQYYHSTAALDRRTMELQQIESQRQRAMAMATKEFNLAKAVEGMEQQQRERQREEEDNRMEIQNQLQVVNLHEGDPGSASVMGLARLWLNKGLTAEHKKQLVDYRQRQMEEKKRASVAEQQREFQQDVFRMASTRTALLLEREQARMTREQRRAMDNANAQLAEGQSERRTYFERDVNYAPDESYFAQFNTSSR
ncbi:hypothetical protein AGOR_G00186220 [Albula goreensis]|uniref:RIB43A-like with coiled-coils protein 2 n=1 Tax=Albula goreensis TaxID=1534307 RepID=A0A8T3CXS2_9TELE|nr:hypothetical protein AGOR_G00186220 [Albula goreensis]